MLTRLALTALAATLVLGASPAAFAAKGQKPRVEVKPLGSRTSGGSTTATTRRRAQVKPLPNSMARAPRASASASRTAVAPLARETTRAPRGGRSFRPTRSPKPSIGKNLGWGTFFGTLGVASLLTGGTSAVGGLVIFGAAAGYNFVKAYLNNKRNTTAEQSRDIAFNAGWGTFWTGLGVHALASGDPFSAAIGLGAGVYNAYKIYKNGRELPAD